MLVKTSKVALTTLPVRPTEWPTVLLAIVIHGGFLALTFWWQSVPLFVLCIVGGWLIAWHGSLQHEVMHNHPTGNPRINDAIGSIPLSLWLPYPIYKMSHLEHHRDEFLTDPIEDPESSYFTRAAWQKLGAFGRLLARWNTTLLGRLIIGPAVMILSFLAQEVPMLVSNEPGRRWIWARHGLGVLAVLAWVTMVCGMPAWLYFFGFVYVGAAMTRLRSFAEHKYAESHEERTAIVENSQLFGVLFLYNNLHVLHHRKPGISWYRLPAVYREQREMLVRANGGLVYDGYWDIVRRFLLKPHDSPTHPHH
jgi:fatty acid desaturase